MKVNVTFAGSVELSVEEIGVLKSLVIDDHFILENEIAEKVEEVLKNTGVIFEETTLVKLVHEDPDLNEQVIYGC